jgi:hypothetical protein
MFIEVGLLFVSPSGDTFPIEVTLAGTNEEMYEQMMEFVLDMYRSEKLMLKEVLSIKRK